MSVCNKLIRYSGRKIAFGCSNHKDVEIENPPPQSKWVCQWFGGV